MAQTNAIGNRTSTLTVDSGLTVSAGTTSITGITNINTTGATTTSLATGGTGILNLGNATGNTDVTGSLTASTGLTATAGGITATGTSNINTTGSSVTSVNTGGTGALNLGNTTGNTAMTGNLAVSSGVISSSSATNYSAYTASYSGADVVPPIITYRKSRTGGVITAGDQLGQLVFYGHDGTGYILSSAIIVTNQGTVATNRIGSKMDFYTHPDSTVAASIRMTIASTGAVIIAAPDSGVGLTISGGGLTVTGNVTNITTFGRTVGVSGIPVLCDNTGAYGTVASSIRYKTNVNDMGSSSDDIMKLRPVTFNFRSDTDNNLNFGLIAEEVHEIMPELVVYDQEDRPESVKYHEMPAMLLNEIQKLNKRILELESKIK